VDLRRIPAGFPRLQRRERSLNRAVEPRGFPRNRRPAVAGGMGVPETVGMSISSNLSSRPLTRRQAFGIGGALGLGAFLASCSGSGPSGTTSATSASASASASGSSTSPASAASGATGTAVVLDDSTGQTLDALFDKVFASTGVAGMAAGVWIGADSWLRSAGYADLTTKGTVPAVGPCADRQHHQVVHGNGRVAVGRSGQDRAHGHVGIVRPRGDERRPDHGAESARDDLRYLRFHFRRGLSGRIRRGPDDAVVRRPDAGNHRAARPAVRPRRRTVLLRLELRAARHGGREGHRQAGRRDHHLERHRQTRPATDQLSNHVGHPGASIRPVTSRRSPTRMRRSTMRPSHQPSSPN